MKKARNFLLIPMIFIPSFVLAAIIPCGPGTGKPECHIADLYTLIASITNWVVGISFTLAVVGIIYSGAEMIISSASSDKATASKARLQKIVWGLVWIFGAYVVVRFIVNLLSGGKTGFGFDDLIGVFGQ